MGPAAVCDGRDWPHPRREVHFALENDGWNCPLECEVHVWASEGVRRGRRRPALAHPRHHDNPDPRAAVPGEKGSMCAFRRFRVSFPPVSRAFSAGFGEEGAGLRTEWRRADGGRGRPRGRRSQ